MKSAAFIPIKAHSERVPGKNLRLWRGRPLYQWIISHAIDAGCFDAVFVDTDSGPVYEYASGIGAQVIQRDPAMATNQANGNDLLAHHYDLHPGYDCYFQLFATAPDLQPSTIRNCVDAMRAAKVVGEHDSIMTGRWIRGWYWLTPEHPLYRPSILPRSQDWVSLWQESTGLYGITGDSLRRLRQRIGAKPILHAIEQSEMMDIDTPEDMAIGATA